MKGRNKQLMNARSRRFFLASLGGITALAFPQPVLALRKAADDAPFFNWQPDAGANRARSVGIAFGGGSMHGVAHVGVLKALVDRGLAFQCVAGTSVGAIVGVLAAAQLPIAEIEKFARQIEWPGVLSLAWSGKGLMQNEKLRAAIDSALGGRRLEQLPIPFGAITTDLATGERVVLRRGAAGAAINASCSIPVLFEPVLIDGRSLVDGGLTEPVPVIAAREMGADLVIAVDVAFRPGEDRFYGLSGVAFQSFQIMANALIKEQLRHAEVAIRLDLHRLIGKPDSHARLIAAGYAAAANAWPKIARLMS